MINPETAKVEDTISIGDIADRIAVSDDGQFLYVGIGSRALIKRYQLQSHNIDLQISVGTDAQGRNLMPASMIVLPGQPNSILIARGYWPAVEPPLFPIASQDIAVFDGAVQRPQTVALNVSSLYVRPSTGSIYGWGSGQVSGLVVTAAGVSQTWSTPVSFTADSMPTWSGRLVTDRTGYVFDLDADVTLGRLSPSNVSSCLLVADPAGASAFVAQGDFLAASLVQYSLANFRATASVNLGGNQDDFLGGCDYVSVLHTWGADGIAISAFQHSGGGSHLVFFHATGLAAIAPPPLPTPIVDPSGSIRLPLPATGMVYDATRNLLWAGVPGIVASVGNSIVSVDPATGKIVDVIYAGGEPATLAISTDGSRLFATLAGSPVIAVLDLNAKRLAQTFSILDAGANSPNWKAFSLAAVPNKNDSVVVVRVVSLDIYTSSVVVYQNGVPLPDSFASYVDRIYPGDAASTFYATATGLQYAGGTHDVYRLAADPSGIHLDRQLNPLGLGSDPVFWSGLLYDRGNLFTSAGELWTPDTSQLLGRFGSDGLPVGFSDQDRIAYVQTTGVTLFDISTLRPLALVPFTAYQIRTMTAAVRIGANVIGASIGGDILLIPLSSMPTWSSYSGQLQSAGTNFQRLDIPVSAMSVLPGTSKLLLATPSRAGSLGNSIITFDMDAGHLDAAAYVGSEPTLLAPSPDGSAVYGYASGERHIVRVNLTSGGRDLVFAADPTGGASQYSVSDILEQPDGSLAVSDDGGAIAVFDNGTPRPVVDWNTQGAYAYVPATFKLASDQSGGVLYAFNTFLSTFEFKRDSVSPDGVRWLSSVGGLISGYYTEIRYSQGLLYTSNGDVIDPERSRRVGRFVSPNTGFYFAHILLDPAAGRAYFSSLIGSQIAVFDMHTYAYLGSVTVPVKSYSYSGVQSMVKFGEDGLAYLTNDGEVYLTRISSIALLAAPVPSPQPTLPATSGVSIIDLASQDIAYDSSRNLLYATVPNSEAAFGDRIAAVDLATGKLVIADSAGTGPRLLALSSDQNRLYFTSGLVNNPGYNGFSATSEGVRTLDLVSGLISPSFAVIPPGSDTSYSILDLAAIPGQPQSIATIHNLYENYLFPDGTRALFDRGPVSLRIFDNATQRPNALGLGSIVCTSLQAGAAASTIYCGSTSSFSRLSVDNYGLAAISTTAISAGNGTFGHFVFNGGRIYTTTGLVLDAQTMDVIFSVPAQGPVAIDGALVYWLDPSGSDPSQPSVMLRSFDIATLQPIASKQIKVTSPDVTRLVAAGQGRLAFRAGREIYIVYSDGSHTGVIEPVLPPPRLDCSFSLSPGGQAYPATGGLGTIRVTINNLCAWAPATGSDWITISGKIVNGGFTTVQYQSRR